MFIWKLNGKEQMDRPQGIREPSRIWGANPKENAPADYPHRVEYLDTEDHAKGWVVICDNPRNYWQELADRLHGKLCHFNHTDGCGWTYSNWQNPCSTRDHYLEKANKVLNAISNTLSRAGVPVTTAIAFNMACDVLDAL